MWAVFGSFASVLIYRIKSGEGGILAGRSHCTSCNKVLQAIDLVPIFSYLFHFGKCRQCSKKVSMIYPLLEITMWLVFVATGYFMVDFASIASFQTWEILKLLWTLFLGFIVVTFSFYDILFLEIPDEILIIWIAWVFAYLSYITIFPDAIPTLPSIFETTTITFYSFLAVLVWACIILWMYVIMLKELSTKYDLLILFLSGLFLIWFWEFLQVSILEVPVLSWVVAAYFLFLFFYAQILVSGGAWLGGGDLRIAILMGLVLGANTLFFWVLASYVAGSIIGIGIILYKKLVLKQKGRVNTVIPFWPFLGFWLLFALFLQDTVYYIL